MRQVQVHVLLAGLNVAEIRLGDPKVPRDLTLLQTFVKPCVFYIYAECDIEFCAFGIFHNYTSLSLSK